MSYAFYAAAILYAVLCVIAPAIKYQRWKDYPSLPMMMVGGLSLGTSLVLKSSGFRNAWLLALLALICIAVSAWKNAAIQGQRHWTHHLVRWGLSLLLLIGFALL